MTQEQLRANTQAALEIVRTIGEIIQEVKTIPSGHLYAMLMSNFTLTQYQSVIKALETAKLITVSKSHLITWTGPAKVS